MNTEPSMDETLQSDGDILTFRDIAERIWGGRWLILLVPVFAVAATIVYILLSYVQANSPIVYYVDLRNIENGEYPNGSQFSPDDLLVPEVRAELRRRFDLPTTPPLNEVITVAHGSPRVDGIVNAFQARLANRNLTSVEIESINRQYAEQLESAMRSGLAIEVNHRHLGVDAATATAMARALPEIWTEIFTTNYRVHTDTGLADASISRSEEDLRSTGSILIANNRLLTIRRGLETISQDNRLRLVVNSDGQTAEDLLQDLRNFQTVYFNSLMTMTLASDDPMARLYLAELSFDIEKLRREAEAHDRTLEAIRGVQRPVIGQEPEERLPAVSATEREVLQLNDGALSQILRISERASFTEFMQETLLARQEIMFQISTMERQRATVTETLGVRETANLREAAASILSEITRQYLDLVQRSRDLLIRRGGEFYEPSLGPIETGPSLIQPRNLLTIAVAGFAGLMFAFLLALLWPSMRGVSRRRA